MITFFEAYLIIIFAVPSIVLGGWFFYLLIDGLDEVIRFKKCILHKWIYGERANEKAHDYTSSHRFCKKCGATQVYVAGTMGAGWI